MDIPFLYSRVRDLVVDLHVAEEIKYVTSFQGTKTRSTGRTLVCVVSAAMEKKTKEEKRCVERMEEEINRKRKNHVIIFVRSFFTVCERQTIQWTTKGEQNVTKKEQSAR